MSPKKLLSAALVSSTLLVSGLASAATTVTFAPSATNGGAGTLNAAQANFQAVGFQSNLFSTLVVNSNSGSNVGFNETGVIDITSFVDASSVAVASGVGGSSYHIFGNFTISGTGNWAGTTYTANQAGLSFVVNLVGDPGVVGGPTFNLGTATLAPGPALAFAIATGSLAPGASGSAFTSLTALLDFTPAAGTTGVGGFFEAPSPFTLALSVGNAGGNFLNTGYSVDAGGVVTFQNPITGTNPGTANVTFENRTVPEPGALSLAGLALVGVAFARRRKAAATV